MKYLLLLLLLAACAQTDPDTVQLPTVNCTAEQVAAPLNGFGLNLSARPIKGCVYGYGGGYSITLEIDNARLRYYYSGMGSGGHGSEAYELAIPESNKRFYERARASLCGYFENESRRTGEGSDVFAEDYANAAAACRNGTFEERVNNTIYLRYKESQVWRAENRSDIFTISPVASW